MWNSNPNQANHLSSPQSNLPSTAPITLTSNPTLDSAPSPSIDSPNPTTIDKDPTESIISPDPHLNDLPVPSPSETNNFFKQSTSNDQLGRFTNAPGGGIGIEKSPSNTSSNQSQSAVHPFLKQQDHQASNTSPFNAAAIKNNQQSSPTLVGPGSPSSAKFKTRSQGGRPKDAVWVYFHTNGNGTDERATCKYCGWHVERPKAFRMRDHVAQCAQIDPVRRAEMSQLIALKEAAAAAKQEEKANATTTGTSVELGSAPKKKKVDHPVIPRPVFTAGKSPVTCHVLDATSGKPGDEMGIRLDRLTSNGFVLIANGTTDHDGRCNTLLPGGSRPEIGIYKVTFFSNEFYQKRGIVSFYPFVEITFEVKDPTEHYHIPLLLSPYSFSTYRGS